MIGHAVQKKEKLEDALEVLGGDACDLASYYQKNGSCAEDVTEAPENIDLKNRLSYLKESYYWADTDGDYFPIYRRMVNEAYSEGLPNSEPISLQTQSSKEMNEHLRKVMLAIQTGTESQIGELYQRACNQRGRQPVHFSSCVAKNAPAPSKSALTLGFILKYLSSPQVQPLAIGFCADIFQEGRGYRGLNSIGNHAHGEECGDHEALVIGKKRDPSTGSCQILVQNSNGSDCKNYSADWTCEDGKVWIDATDLAKNIEDFAYLR